MMTADVATNDHGTIEVQAAIRMMKSVYLGRDAVIASPKSLFLVKRTRMMRG